MASKKSAKSKGYRKTVQKKPYLTKKEIILTCVIVAAVILAFVLMNVLYSDGSLKLVDGVPQAEGEHSILVNAGTANNPRYFKLGQAGEVEGYTLTENESASDANILTFSYTPDSDSFVDSATVAGTNASAASTLSYVAAMYASVDGYNSSDIQTETIDGKEVTYLTVATDPDAIRASIAASQTETAEDAAAAEEVTETTEETVEETAEVAEETTEAVDEESAEATEEESAEDAIGYAQELTAYIPSGERYIVVSVINEGESAEDYVSDEALVDVLKQIMSSITYETK